MQDLNAFVNTEELKRMVLQITMEQLTLDIMLGGIYISVQVPSLWQGC